MWSLVFPYIWCLNYVNNEESGIVHNFFHTYVVNIWYSPNVILPVVVVVVQIIHIRLGFHMSTFPIYACVKISEGRT